MGNAESFKQHTLYSLQSQKEKPVEKEGLRMEGEGKWTVEAYWWTRLEGRLGLHQA